MPALAGNKAATIEAPKNQLDNFDNAAGGGSNAAAESPPDPFARGIRRFRMART
jgi:hypothetical protein